MCDNNNNNNIRGEGGCAVDLDVACSRKVFAELVERGGQNAVGSVKGLFHPVPMMDVDVDVENPLVMFQKFKNRKNAIVDIAKAGSFALFCVMESPGPIDHNVILPFV